MSLSPERKCTVFIETHRYIHVRTQKEKLWRSDVQKVFYRTEILTPLVVVFFGERRSGVISKLFLPSTTSPTSHGRHSETHKQTNTHQSVMVPCVREKPRLWSVGAHRRPCIRGNRVQTKLLGIRNQDGGHIVIHKYIYMQTHPHTIYTHRTTPPSQWVVCC